MDSEGLSPVGLSILQDHELFRTLPDSLRLKASEKNGSFKLKASMKSELRWNEKIR